MKVNIIFTPNETGALVLTAIHDEDGNSLEPLFADDWAADGEYEQLTLDVLPPLDKVTLTVVGAKD